MLLQDFLLQTCKIPCPTNCCCLYHCLLVLSLVSRLDNYQALRPAGCSPATDEPARRPRKLLWVQRCEEMRTGDRKLQRWSWGGRPPAYEALGQLFTTTDVFLFHYSDDILLTSESLSTLKVAAPRSWLIWLHGDGWWMQTEHKDLGYLQNASIPPTHPRSTTTGTGFRDVNWGTGLGTGVASYPEGPVGPVAMA